MNVKTLIKYSLTALFAFVISIIVSGQAFLSAFLSPQTVFAGTETVYSDVLEDLHNNANFNENDYPNVNNNYILEVITIAESVNNELFVYVYQPSDGFAPKNTYIASSIDISTATGEELDYKNYSLEYLNNSGVFYKYKVKNFTVSGAITRLYEISDILRPFNEQLGDKQPDNDNTINEVSFAVSKQFKFERGSNGKSYLTVEDIETIKITDKFVGFVRYMDGFKLYLIGACDSHFVAFNTDKDISQLLEADVFFTKQSYSDFYVNGKEKEIFGSTSDTYAYLKYTDKVEYNGDGLFSTTYKWDRIQTVEDFINSENKENIYSGAILNITASSKLTDEALTSLKGKKWVLRFTETEYLFIADETLSENSTIVGDVKILRLRFLDANGNEFNLGVVDNKQSGSTDPSNETEIKIELKDEFETLIKLILGIAALILLWPLVSPLLIGLIKYVFKGFILIIKGVFKIILFPFELLFKKRRRK